MVTDAFNGTVKLNNSYTLEVCISTWVSTLFDIFFLFSIVYTVYRIQFYNKCDLIVPFLSLVIVYVKILQRQQQQQSYIKI